MSNGYFSLGRSGACSIRTQRWMCLSAFGLLASHAFAGTPPEVWKSPGEQSVFVGQNVKLSVLVSSESPVSYQWTLDSIPVPGATNNFLELFSASLTHSGRVCRVVASNAFGASWSEPTVLKVKVPDYGPSVHAWGFAPELINQQFRPSDYRHEIGRAFLVDLQDTSSGGLWGTKIYSDDSSVAAAAYHAGVLPKGKRGTVAVGITGPQPKFIGSAANGVVSGSSGEWPGSFEVMGAVPTITKHPRSQVRSTGGKATFVAEAEGTGAVRYQWMHNGVRMPGETNSILEFQVQSDAQAGSYAAFVYDDTGGLATDYAILAVLPNRPAGRSGITSSLANLEPGEFRHVIVTGQTNPGTLSGSGFYALESDLHRAATHDGWVAHGETAVLTFARLPEQPFFLGGDRNSISSNRGGRGGAFAIAGKPPYVLKDPLSQAVLPGQFCRLTVEAVHQKPMSVQWRRDGNPIPGANTGVYHVSAGAPGSLASYDAIVSVPGGSIITEAALVFTVTSNARVLRTSNMDEAVAHLTDASTLVYAPLTGATAPSFFWGTGVYTASSDPASTSVHADRLLPGETAEVGMYTTGYRSGYIGSTRNGITSAAIGWSPGYVFLFPPYAPPAPTLAIAGQGSLIVSGEGGHNCQVWGAPSIGGPWALLDTFWLGAGSSPWVDAQSPATRFYRAVLIP